MQAVLGAITASAAFQSLIALWEDHTGRLLNLYSTAGTQQFAANYFYSYGTTKRPTGTFNDPISLGNFLAISLPLAFVLAVKVKGRLSRALVIIATMSIAAALTLTLSRASWIGGVVGCLLATAMLPRPQRRTAARGIVGGVAVIALVAAIAAGPAVLGRLVSITQPTKASGVSQAQQGVARGDQDRLKYWGVALFDAFGGHPLAGVGIGNLNAFMLHRVATSGTAIRAGTLTTLHAHSTYFELLGEAGLFGLALLALFMASLFRDARAGPKRDAILGAGLAGAGAALLICWVTDWVIQYLPVAACVGIVLGAIAAGGSRVFEIEAGPG
jgi:O-antigen ligase